MVQAFKVGKNYKRSCEIGECVWSGEVKALFIIGYRHVLVDQYNRDWEEYKEPRKVERWINISDKMGKLCMSDPFITREIALSYIGKGYITTVKFEYVEKV
jgi:hypothetical protein